MNSKFLINGQLVDGTIDDIDYDRFVKATIPGLYGGRPHVYTRFTPVDKGAPICSNDKCMILWEEEEK